MRGGSESERDSDAGSNAAAESNCAAATVSVSHGRTQSATFTVTAHLWPECHSRRPGPVFMRDWD